MLLRISTTHRPATDLGFLLQKHPGRAQSFPLPFGRAHVFYPEAREDRCTAALLLDVDPIGIARRGPGQEGLAPYVSDRPYVASSFLSVAIARVLGSALSGRCPQRPELAARPLPLEARLAAVACRDGPAFLHRLFEPLGYEVVAEREPLDEAFPEWGEGATFVLTLRAVTRLRDLLGHLYVLVPVLDDEKHYFVGDDEVQKLLRLGESWLPGHPERETIVRRYLKHQRRLAREALARLTEDDPDVDAAAASHADTEHSSEAPLRLNDLRLEAVHAELRGAGAGRVVDLGCGEGALLRRLADDPAFLEIVGLDVSVRSLERARARLPEDRVRLLHGSLTYRDARLSGFDTAAAVEVIEHLDPPRLAAFERVVLEHARPRALVLTTPNAEYNALFPGLASGRFRHPDHRFEWTRSQLDDWSRGAAARFGYSVRLEPVGPADAGLGAPTQMAVFTRA
jgi:3' terminal RNA ribose 2'-O-methyltransferase Hen1